MTSFLAIQLRRVITLSCIAAVLSCSGCVSVGFEEPISNFSTSVAGASLVVGEYYGQMNEFEREIYLTERKYNPNLEVLTNEGGNPTPLVHFSFAPESIQARMDAIALLGAYAEQLSKLAGSESPANFATGVSALGDNLAKLDSRFQDISKADKEGKTRDGSAQKYAGPISHIIAAIGKLALQLTRDQMIRDSIKEGSPAVRKILALLETDFVEVINLQQATGLHQLLLDRVTYYNKNRSTVTLAERQALLEEIGDIAARREAFATANPVSVIQRMRTAHDALEAYALHPDDAATFKQLVADLAVLKSTVSDVINAVLRIRSLSHRRNQ
jgi:hypothetical protein